MIFPINKLQFSGNGIKNEELISTSNSLIARFIFSYNSPWRIMKCCSLKIYHIKCLYIVFILALCLSKLNLKHFARHVSQLIRSKDFSLHRETAMIAPYVIKNCSPLALAYCLKLIFYTFQNIYA